MRQLLPASAIVGLSTHTPDEIAQSTHEAVTYVAVGPAYQTATKDTGHAVVGLELVRHAVSAQSRPVVAIGGITLDRALDVIQAGASAVAVISDLLAGGTPERRVGDYVAMLESPTK